MRCRLASEGSLSAQVLVENLIDEKIQNDH